MFCLKSILAAATLTGLLLVNPVAAATKRCAFEAPPRVLSSQGDPHARGGRLLQMWEMRDDPVLWSTSDPDGYATFRAKVRTSAGETDPLKLLSQTDTRNNKVVAANPKWIGPATCLEKLLQQTQDQRIDTFTAPTEYLSFVLRSKDGKRLRVYFYTINEDGIGRTSPAADPAAEDHRQGWTIVAGMHNHNFHPGQPAVNGPLAPSAPDAQFNAGFAKTAGMKAAWITNGLHTARIPAAAFSQFEGAE